MMYMFSFVVAYRPEQLALSMYFKIPLVTSYGAPASQQLLLLLPLLLGLLLLLFLL